MTLTRHPERGRSGQGLPATTTEANADRCGMSRPEPSVDRSGAILRHENQKAVAEDGTAGEKGLRTLPNRSMRFWLLATFQKILTPMCRQTMTQGGLNRMIAGQGGS